MKLRRIHTIVIVILLSLFIMVGYYVSDTDIKYNLYIGHTGQNDYPSIVRIDPNKFLFKVQPDNAILPQRDNVIYYGSNEKVGDYFNQESVLKAFTNASNPNLLKRFPRCICIGSVKSGMQALLEFLDLHPQIKSVPNEITYFAHGDRFDIQGYDRYLTKMPYSTRHELTLQKSSKYTSYIDRKAAERLHKFDPSMQLLYVVRNPIDRTFSEYLQTKRDDKTGTTSFEDFVIRPGGNIKTNYDPIHHSMYYDFLSGWFEYFPRYQIHIVNGDELVKNPAEEVGKIEDFMGIDRKLTNDVFYFNATKGFYCYHTNSGGSKCLSNDYGHKDATMSQDTRNRLRSFFEQPNKKFFKLVGQTFDWDK